MTRLQGIYPLIGEHGWPVEWSVRAAAEMHNPDRKFSEMVCSVYEKVDVPSLGASDGSPVEDGRPVIYVRAVGRFGQALRVRGTAWLSDGDSLVIEVSEGSPNGPAGVECVLLPGAHRRGWYADLPVSARNVHVRIVSLADDCFAEIAAEVDLAKADVRRDLSLATPARATAIVEPTSASPAGASSSAPGVLRSLGNR